MRSFRQPNVDPRVERAKLCEELQVLDARAEPTAGLALAFNNTDDGPADAALAYECARTRLGANHYTPLDPAMHELPAAAEEHDGGNAENQAEEDYGQDDRGRRANHEPELPADSAPQGWWPSWDAVKRAREAQQPAPRPPAKQPSPAALPAGHAAQESAGRARRPAANQDVPQRLDHRGFPLRRMC